MLTRVFLAGLVLAASAAAQPLAVTAVYPTRNSLTASPGSIIVVAFNQPVNPATVTPASFQVFGRWSGVVAGQRTLVAGGQAILFQPTRPCFAGETVTVNLSSAVTATGGSALTVGHAWSFWVRPAPGPGVFTPVQNTSLRRVGEGHIQTYGSYCGDLDGDGTPDLSFPNEISSDVRVLRNDGWGGFFGMTVHPLPPNSTPSPNEGADFNGDGKIDMAIANTTGHSMSVLIGDGAGGYQPHTTYPSGTTTRGLAVLDVEADGDMDVVTANYSSSNLALHRNRGDGTFQPAAFFEGGGSGERGLAAADANGDGIMDLVVGHYDGRTVTVCLGNGAGGYTASGTTSVPGQIWMLVTGDVDGDGNVDVALANSNQASASVLRGNGAGGLLPPVTYPSGNFPIAVDVGDLDGDADLDLIVSSFGSANWTVYWNNGAGVFGSPFTLPSQNAGSCMLVVDTDHDGDVDLLGIDEVVDRFFVFNQIIPPAPGVQPASQRATLRVNDLASHGGYAGVPPHPVSAGGSFFMGIGGAPNSAYSLAVGVPFEPGVPTPVGILNLTFPLFFILDGLGGNPAAVTDARGQDLERFVLPPGLPIGFTIGLQAAVAPVFSLTNPERIVVVP